jgi:penicillin-binding protein 2
MIEKYLKDSVTGTARLAQIEQLSNLNLIPSRIYAALKTQDSLRHLKDSAYLVAKGYLKGIKDTIGLEQDDESDLLEKIKEDTDTTIEKELPKKDSNNNRPVIKTEAVLPNGKRKPELKDTVKN